MVDASGCDLASKAQLIAWVVVRALVVVTFAFACTSRDAPTIIVPDAAAPRPDANRCHTSPCSPLTQMNCNAGDKCTWLVNLCGSYTGCGILGDVPRGAACARGAYGVDDCRRGDVCVEGTCRMICDHRGMEPICGSGFLCTTIPGVFTDGTNTIAGVCLP